MNAPLLIGLHGKAGSGKDALGRLLRSQLDKSLRMAFADPVKSAAAVIFDVKHDVAHSPEFKEWYSSYWGLTGRQMLQLLGTEAIRGTFGQDFWVKRWRLEAESFLNAGYPVIVTDVRFENEADAIREMGGTIVHVIRPNWQALDGSEGAHASEAGIQLQLWDYTVSNDGTLEDLGRKAEHLLRWIRSDGANHGAQS